MKKNHQLNIANFLIAIAVTLLTLAIWAYFNRPEQQPPWPKRIQGLSFSPMREDDDPLERKLPTQEEIEADLKLLAGKTYAVRTYSVEDVGEQFPKLAKKYNINVTIGAWIDKRLDHNAEEIKKAIAAANENQNVVRVIVGNEAILRGDLTAEEMIPYLDHVRAEIGQPVSTAEPWHVYVKNPTLAEHVDFLAVHILPYWEGIHLDNAVEYVVQQMNALKVLFPDKPIVITEAGWPSHARTLRSAVASLSNQATFLRQFIHRAEKENYIYYIMEAFDQPWKKRTEGAIGAYWGIYDVERQPKFPFKDPIIAIPHWYVLAGISILIAIIAFSLLLIDSQTLKTRGRSFLALMAFAATTWAVWIAYDFTLQYLTIQSVVVGVLMFSGMVGVIVVILTEAHEWAEAIWVRERRRAFKPLPFAIENAPLVSIHVATYNEPPDMVIETLNALAELDYPCFEVIVMDNNTKDLKVWQPVKDYCETLGERFHFFHEDSLRGFKAGALNYALQKTHPDAQIIGVIDSDYVVDKNWLRDLVTQFSQEKIAIVQAPQDYRDGHTNSFKSMCYEEYRGFFFIGMVTRNERNAIIQHGTMTLVRKSVLAEVGGWGEWCITEDAELGLRVFAKGYESIYIPKSYGRGLTPDTFLDYKKQRFRWAFGAMQILKHHFKKIFGFKSRDLSYGQRYHFFAGWLPWIADGFNLIFNMAAILWSVAMLFNSRIDPPLLHYALLPLALFAFKVAKMIYLYYNNVESKIRKIFLAALAGLALSHTIAKAILQALFLKDKPFFRTPKKARAASAIRALFSAREEIFIMCALIITAVLLSQREGIVMLDRHVWVVVLLIQSIPYFASLVMALVSSYGEK